jgi:hypothetical protein
MLTSRAANTYQSIIGADSPVAVIESMIQSRHAENEFLEFKVGTLNPKEAKRYWSRAVSGFANSEGGVLIWGVDARKMPSDDDPSVEIDAAFQAVPVPKPIEFADLLRRLLLEATIDPVSGIEVLSIPATNGGGFVVCFVPEGKHKPYRAALEESRNYYQRIGDSFSVISHSFLRSLFYPQLSPALSITVSFKVTSVEEDEIISGRVSLHNSGTGTARDIKVRAIAKYRDWAITPVIDQTDEQTAVRTYKNNFRILVPRSDLHPGDSIDLCVLRWDGPTTSFEIGRRRRHELQHHEYPDAPFEFRIYCSDHPEHFVPAVFTANEVNDRETRTFYSLQS